MSFSFKSLQFARNFLYAGTSIRCYKSYAVCMMMRYDSFDF